MESTKAIFYTSSGHSETALLCIQLYLPKTIGEGERERKQCKTQLILTDQYRLSLIMPNSSLKKKVLLRHVKTTIKEVYFPPTSKSAARALFHSILFPSMVCKIKQEGNQQNQLAGK